MMTITYVLTNEELQDAIVQTNAMVKSYGEKIPEMLMVHYYDLLSAQKKRARLVSLGEQEKPF